MDIVIPQELFEDDAPRGLARCDATALAQLRQIILTVIDDGDPAHRNWRFYEGLDQTSSADVWVTEAVANEQRLRFCDAIEAEIVRLTTPAAAKAGDGNGGAR